MWPTSYNKLLYLLVFRLMLCWKIGPAMATGIISLALGIMVIETRSRERRRAQAIRIYTLWVPLCKAHVIIITLFSSDCITRSWSYH